MSEAMTELPPGAVLAKTWEDCAAHLEQHADMGGEVWIKDPQGRWHRGEDTAGVLRGLSSAPGKGGWFPRALVPPKWRPCDDPAELAAAVAAGVEVQWNKPGWSPGAWGQSTASSEASFAAAMREGNRYRVPSSWEWEPCATDPCEACAAKLASVPDVPEGHELVVLPSEVVDEWRRGWGYVLGDEHRVHPDAVDHMEHVVAACRAAVARRPKPEPRTERVPWWEAVGERVPEGLLIAAARLEVDDQGATDGPVVTTRLGSLVPWLYSDDGTPTVEVLRRDGEW